MKKFKLPEKFKRDRDYWVYSEYSVSNGAFAIKDELLDSPYKYKDPKQPMHPQIEKLWEIKTTTTYHKTEWIKHKDKDLMRLFESESGEKLFIDEVYCKFFGLEILEGTDNKSPLLAMDGNFLIMPMKG